MELKTSKEVNCCLLTFFTKMALNDTSEEGQSFAAEVSKGLVLSGITFATIVGNSLSLLAIHMTGKSQAKHLIMSLAVSDLTLGILVMPFTTITSIKRNWIFGSKGCLAQGGLGFLLCEVSVITITSVSVERYILFAYPNHYFKWLRSNSNSVKYIITLTWVYGGVWTFLAWQTSRFSFTRELLNCVVDWRYNKTFTLVCGIITSCLPMSVTSFCNFKVLQILWRWKFSRRTGSENNRSKRNAAQVKISRMLLIVVTVFLVCWTPYSVGGLCYLLPDCNWPEEFYVASVFLCLLNSSINPIIYGTFDRRFRRSLRLIVCDTLFLRKRTNVGPSYRN